MRSRRLGRTVRRAIAGPVALVLFAGAAAAAPADTKSQISDAQRRLAALEDLISSGQAKVLEVQASMRTLAAKVEASRLQYQGIRDQIARTRARRAEVQAEYRAI